MYVLSHRRKHSRGEPAKAIGAGFWRVSVVGCMMRAHPMRGPMMAPRTIHVTREQLLSRRAAILEDLGMSLEEFRRRAEAGTLVGDEWYAESDLEEIDFLLRDDAA